MPSNPTNPRDLTPGTVTASASRRRGQQGRAGTLSAERTATDQQDPCLVPGEPSSNSGEIANKWASRGMRRQFLLIERSNERGGGGGDGTLISCQGQLCQALASGGDPQGTEMPVPGLSQGQPAVLGGAPKVRAAGRCSERPPVRPMKPTRAGDFAPRAHRHQLFY